MLLHRWDSNSLVWSVRSAKEKIWSFLTTRLPPGDKTTRAGICHFPFIEHSCLERKWPNGFFVLFLCTMQKAGLARKFDPPPCFTFHPLRKISNWTMVSIDSATALFTVGCNRLTPMHSFTAIITDWPEWGHYIVHNAPDIPVHVHIESSHFHICRIP